MGCVLDDLPPSYSIAFKVPYGLAMKEIEIKSDASWAVARTLIAAAMEREVSLLRVGYGDLPWEKAKKLSPPTLLQKEEEWNSLMRKVNAHIDSQTRTARGLPKPLKPFSIILVNVTDDGSPVTVSRNATTMLEYTAS